VRSLDGFLNILDVITLIYFIAPSYAANSTPVIFSGNKPLDLGKSFFDGEKIFGSNKTLKGTAGGLLCGFIVSILEYVLIPLYHPSFGFIVVIGAILGDLFGAFVKRRIKIKPGDPAPLLDQLDFIFGAALLVYFLYAFPLKIILFAVLITPPIHFVSNAFAYILRLKDKYW
jgi:CDP-2,3-bis-(O-geranylgeranyl)-sn-glycerol synthase